MTDSTDPTVPLARTEPPTPCVEDDLLTRSRVGRRAAHLLAGAAVLSTTALMPAGDPKIPPWEGD